jgi:flavodoxin
MSALVLFSSKTGNTRKLAQTVFDNLPGEKVMLPVDEAPDLSAYDLVAVGFWLQGGQPDPKTAAVLPKVAGRRLFLFATHGAATDSEHAANAMAQARSLAPKAQVVGTFSCPGEVDPAFLEKARAKNPQPPWIKNAPAAIGHPDRADLDRLAQTVKALPPDTSA